MIRASAPYTSGWDSFVLLNMDRVRVARGGSLSTLHWFIETRNVTMKGRKIITINHTGQIPVRVLIPG